jgi:hypothetical protein
MYPTNRTGKVGRAIAAVLLMLGSLFGPLAFGATQVWSLCLLQLLTVLAAIAWLASGAPNRRWLWLPVAVAAVGYLQVSSLPGAWLNSLAPLSSDVRAALRAQERTPPSVRVSLSPGKTRLATRQACLAALLFIAASGVARDPRLRMCVVWAAGCSGVFVLLLGYATWNSRTGPLLGFHDMRGPCRSSTSSLLPLLHSAGNGGMKTIRVGNVGYGVDEWTVGDTLGPYVVSNHFAGCMELTIPLCVALIWGANHRSRVKGLARKGVACALALSAVIAVSVEAWSWAGTASLLLALLCVAYGLAAPGLRRCLCGVALVGFLATWAWLFALLCRAEPSHAASPAWLPAAAQKTLAERQAAARGRLQASETGAEIFRRSPWLGIGLGAYADVSPKFTGPLSVQGFVHNDYVQLAAEAGVFGCLVAVAALIFAALYLRRGKDNSPIPTDLPLAVGISASLVGFLAHGFFDWNMHVPANAWIFAVWAGTLVGMNPASIKADSGRDGSTKDRWRNYAVCAIVMLFVVWCTHGIVRHLMSDKLIQPLRYAVVVQRLPELTERAKRQVLQDGLPDAIRAMENDPWDADGAETIARAYLHLSRGLSSPELVLAEQWFERALTLSPCRDRIGITLMEIEQMTISAGIMTKHAILMTKHAILMTKHEIPKHEGMTNVE